MREKLPANRSVGFVAELANALREMERRPGSSAEERGRYARWRERAEELGDLLASRRTLPAPFDVADLSGLPPELLSELSGAHADPLAAQIAAVMRACGGRADLDALLIGLYRKFEVVQKRRFLQNKLWRMVRDGQLRKPKGERGMFSLATVKEKPRRRRRNR